MWSQFLGNVRPAVHEHWPKSALVPAALGVGGAVVCWMLLRSRKKTLEMGDGWWALGAPQQREDTSVRAFTLEVSDTEIQDLYQRLDRTRFISPLEDSQFHYGFNSIHLKRVVSYWRNSFEWRKQVELINKYPHYKTTIEGLEVHFIRVKPAHLPPGQKARPLLMVHGWPGSFYEFYRIIPLLTEPAKYGLNPNLAFEIICPSIPGYGFSEAPHKKGFNGVAAARIFYKLMLRLGFGEFYLQGGDWGSLITTLLAQMKPECVTGLHLNMAFVPKGGFGRTISLLLGRYVPWLVGMTWEDANRLYPYFEKNVYALLRESGYMHIQATKPDSVGSALNDSPAGLAAYILEKFSTWTDPEFRKLEDGGLERLNGCPHDYTAAYSYKDSSLSKANTKYSLDDLLTNIMIYWLSGSITSSMRFYKENFTRDFLYSPANTMAVRVPTGIASFPCELMHVPRSWAKGKFRNISSYTYMPRGGHFAALEEPELLARDIQHFVFRVEKLGQ